MVLFHSFFFEVIKTHKQMSYIGGTLHAANAFKFRLKSLLEVHLRDLNVSFELSAAESAAESIV